MGGVDRTTLAPVAGRRIAEPDVLSHVVGGQDHLGATGPESRSTTMLLSGCRGDDEAVAVYFTQLLPVISNGCSGGFVTISVGDGAGGDIANVRGSARRATAA